MMIVSPTPVFRWTDNNGNPAVGWQVETYIAGSSTLVDTYTDATGTAENTNPIILDARGEANIWLDPAISYKYVIKNNLGVVQDTIDQIQAGSGGSGGLTRVYYNDSSSIAFSGLGTVATPLSSSVKLSAQPNNALQVRADGLYAMAIGGGGSVAWGSITGSLSAQTDLIDKFNEYLPLTFGTAQTLTYGSESTYQFLDDGKFSVTDTASGNELRLDALNSAVLFKNNTLQVPSGIALRTWEFPDVSGTIALTTDIAPTKDALQTGVLSGYGISSAGGGTSIDVASGFCRIVSNVSYPATITNVSTPNTTTISIPAGTGFRNVVVSTSGVVSLTTDIQIDPNTRCVLGYITFVGGVLSEVGQDPLVGYSASIFGLDLTRSLGPVRQGMMPALGASLGFGLAEGRLTRIGVNYAFDRANPHTRTYSPVSSPVSFFYATQNNVVTTPSTAINPALRDDGSGGTTAVPSNRFTNQRFFRATNGQVFVQYGQVEYTTIEGAVAGLGSETFTPNPQFLTPAVIQLGALSVKGNATLLNDSTQARWSPASKLGEIAPSSASVQATPTLQQVTDAGNTTTTAINGSTASFSGNVTALLAPTLGGHLTNKTYVDGAVGNYIARNGTTPTTALIPFAQGASFGMITDLYGGNIVLTGGGWIRADSDAGVTQLLGGRSPTNARFIASSSQASIAGSGLSINNVNTDSSAIRIPNESWIRPQTAGQGIYLTNGTDPTVSNSTLHLTTGYTALFCGTGSSARARLELGVLSALLVSTDASGAYRGAVELGDGSFQISTSYGSGARVQGLTDNLTIQSGSSGTSDISYNAFRYHKWDTGISGSTAKYQFNGSMAVAQGASFGDAPSGLAIQLTGASKWIGSGTSPISGGAALLLDSNYWILRSNTGNTINTTTNNITYNNNAGSHIFQASGVDLYAFSSTVHLWDGGIAGSTAKYQFGGGGIALTNDQTLSWAVGSFIRGTSAGNIQITPNAGTNGALFVDAYNINHNAVNNHNFKWNGTATPPTGTQTYLLAIDSNGNLIQGTAGSGFVTISGHNDLTTPWSIGDASTWAGSSSGIQIDPVGSYGLYLKGNAIIEQAVSQALSLYRPVASGDICLNFDAWDSLGVQSTYAQVCGVVVSNTAQAVGGGLDFEVAIAGALTPLLQLRQAGSTLTGGLSVTGALTGTNAGFSSALSGLADNQTLSVKYTGATVKSEMAKFFAPNAINDPTGMENHKIWLGRSFADFDAGYIGYSLVGNNSVDNHLDFGVYNNDHILRLRANAIAEFKGYVTIAQRLRIGGGADDLTNALQVQGSATFSGLVLTPASTTARAGLRVPHGTAPVSPVNGDIWTTSGAFLCRINGGTKIMSTLEDAQTYSGAKTFTSTSGIVARTFRTTQQTNTPTGTTYTWALGTGQGLGLTLTSSTGAVTVTISGAVADARSIMYVTGHGSATRDLSVTLSGATFIMTGKTSGATMLLDTIPINGQACYEFNWRSSTVCYITRLALV